MRWLPSPPTPPPARIKSWRLRHHFAGYFERDSDDGEGRSASPGSGEFHRFQPRPTARAQRGPRLARRGLPAGSGDLISRTPTPDPAGRPAKQGRYGSSAPHMAPVPTVRTLRLENKGRRAVASRGELPPRDNLAGPKYLSGLLRNHDAASSLSPPSRRKHRGLHRENNHQGASRAGLR